VLYLAFEERLISKEIWILIVTMWRHQSCQPIKACVCVRVRVRDRKSAARPHYWSLSVKVVVGQSQEFPTKREREFDETLGPLFCIPQSGQWTDWIQLYLLLLMTAPTKTVCVCVCNVSTQLENRGSLFFFFAVRRVLATETWLGM